MKCSVQRKVDDRVHFFFCLSSPIDFIRTRDSSIRWSCRVAVACCLRSCARFFSEHMVALHYMYYNFGRIHQSLRVTPAMEAGVSDHVWSLDEIIALLD